LTLDRKTHRLQDEAPQGRQVSHEDTLSEEPPSVALETSTTADTSSAFPKRSSADRLDNKRRQTLLRLLHSSLCQRSQTPAFADRRIVCFSRSRFNLAVVQRRLVEVNGIEPSTAQGHRSCGIRHSLSIPGKCKEVGCVKWVTGRHGDWSTNQEIRELSGWPETADTGGNGELAWNDKQLVADASTGSLDSSAVCNEHRSGTSADRTSQHHSASPSTGGRGGARRTAHVP